MRRPLSPRSIAAIALVGAFAFAAWPAVPWAAELGDLVFARPSGAAADIAPAVFPHWIHRMQYKCAACHDDLFKMKAGANPVTMDGMAEGHWCGVCHDGKTAFASTFDTCQRCHRQ